jgi:hypothetical protein
MQHVSRGILMKIEAFRNLIIWRRRFSARLPRTMHLVANTSLIRYIILRAGRAGVSPKFGGLCAYIMSVGGDVMRSPLQHTTEGNFRLRANESRRKNGPKQQPLRQMLLAAAAEMMIDIFPVFALRHNGCRAGNLLPLVYYFDFVYMGADCCGKVAKIILDFYVLCCLLTRGRLNFHENIL